MARAIFEHKIREKGLTHSYKSDSCGTAGYHIGDDADERTIACLEKNGIETHHRARQLQPEDFNRFDWLIAMDRSNYEDIGSVAADSRQQDKIRMMRSFDEEDRGEVPDPYYGTERDFQRVFDMLDQSIEYMIEWLESKGTASDR